MASPAACSRARTKPSIGFDSPPGTSGRTIGFRLHQSRGSATATLAESGHTAPSLIQRRMRATSSAVMRSAECLPVGGIAMSWSASAM
jgi:hypothetical protein